MLIKIKNPPPIILGECNFTHYYPENNNAFSTGIITKIDDKLITVDFGDIVLEFDRANISFVVDTQSNGDEFFMTTDSGRVIRDYGIE